MNKAKCFQTGFIVNTQKNNKKLNVNSNHLRLVFLNVNFQRFNKVLLLYTCISYLTMMSM